MPMPNDIKLFQADGTDRLFLARLEIPKEKGGFQVSGWFADDEAPPEVTGAIHFLTGFPIDTIEMLVAVGEYSSKAKEGEDEKVAVQDGGGKCFAPVWDGESKIFEWPDKDKILLNLTAIAEPGAASKYFSANLPSEPEPTNAHWWLRVGILDGEFPVPGEFVGLGVRLMPGEYWGKQLTSPFIYSGNWFDTVYLTGAKVKEVLEPDDTYAFSRYSVQWRKNLVTANPSDFAEYKVGDRVTLLKDVTATKVSQLWKDEDMGTYGDNWMIVPFSFYGIEASE